MDMIVVPFKITTVDVSRTECVKKHNQVVQIMQDNIEMFKKDNGTGMITRVSVELMGIDTGDVYRMITIIDCILTGTEKILMLILNLPRTIKPHAEVCAIQHKISDKSVAKYSEKALKEATIEAHKRLVNMVSVIPGDFEIDGVAEIVRRRDKGTDEHLFCMTEWSDPHAPIPTWYDTSAKTMRITETVEIVATIVSKKKPLPSPTRQDALDRSSKRTAVLARSSGK